MTAEEEADAQAEQIYYDALNALFYSMDKKPFIEACRRASEVAADRGLKEHYAYLAKEYEKELEAGNGRK